MNRLRCMAGRFKRQVQASLGGRYVLMYHRVERLDRDPWGLAVTPDRFAEHLQVLSGYGPCMTLGEMALRHADGTLPRRAIAVTFDDGYADNLLNALPRLERAGVPATFFLAPGLLDGRTPFWWDELAAILLRPGTIPSRPALREWTDPVEFGAAATLSPEDEERHRGWRVWEPPPTPRHALYLDLWSRLRPLPHYRRQAMLAELAEQTGGVPARDIRNRPMDRDEAARLAASPLAEIGGHTLTHPTLPAQDTGCQLREIRDGRSACEEIAGRHVHSFAYPYGDHGPQTPELVRMAGFTAACVTMAGPLHRGTDSFRLPRIPMQDWSGAELARRLATGDLY